jgi:hypothetical protein
VVDNRGVVHQFVVAIPKEKIGSNKTYKVWTIAGYV